MKKEIIKLLKGVPKKVYKLEMIEKDYFYKLRFCDSLFQNLYSIQIILRLSDDFRIIISYIDPTYIDILRKQK